MKMNGFDWTAMVLVIVGGVNWGLVGFFNYDLVASLFGSESFLSRIVYALVGISALYLVVTAAKLASMSEGKMHHAH